jgi:ABC-type maltose transport system permease subunit
MSLQYGNFVFINNFIDTSFYDMRLLRKLVIRLRVWRNENHFLLFVVNHLFFGLPRCFALLVMTEKSGCYSFPRMSFPRRRESIFFVIAIIA